jgi:peptidoglycan hydrolase-like protein with peptidoglycan-binding domain
MIRTGFVPAAVAIAGFLALAGCSSGNNHATTQSNSVAPVAMAAPVPAAAPEVSPGMIKRIQTALRQQGLYKGRIDGQWGPQTQSAIHSYQQAHNLTDSGQIDSPTLASLQIGSAGTAPSVQKAMPQTAPPAAATTN